MKEGKGIIWIIGTHVLLILILMVLISTGACDSTDSRVQKESSLRVVYISGDIDTISVKYSCRPETVPNFYLRQDGSSLLSKSQVPQPSIVVDQLPLAPPHIVTTNVRSFEVLYSRIVEEVEVETDPLSWIKK